jgi:predicted histone-like DNA-binding protein
MAIKFFKYKRNVFLNKELQEKYMPKMQIETIADFEMIAQMIEKKSSMSRGDILGVLAELETTILWMLENGHPVSLGLLGTFYPAIEVQMVDSPQEVTRNLIKRFKIIFKPSKFFKKRLKNVEFVLGDSEVRGVNYKKK